ncbi:MAG TPA: HAMP domain-containing histidine kinase [Candidatus Tidjanibacter gallistercoris]|nr:HAMP domain-containing histidine kinase [Candidatus Tidjanibacter gallistercoris]
MKPTFQRKLTLSFLVIFVIFTAGVVVFEQRQARRYRTEALEERLDAYAEMIHACAAGNAPAGEDLRALLPLLPKELRLTVIGADGTVVYDNLFARPGELDNHAGRPEVAGARQTGAAYDIRTSASNQVPYIYYAKYFGNDFVRVALPYDIRVKHFLQPDNGFLYFIVLLFAAGLLVIHYVGSRFGRSVRRLRDFAAKTDEGDADINIARFPGDELGEIGRRIAGSYKSLKESEQTLVREREKLLQHVHSSAEGVCFFRPDCSVEFYNGLFLQYMNTISDVVVSDNPALLTLDVFEPVRRFLASGSGEQYFETHLQDQGREFLLRVNVFDDKSFEVVFNDITRQEKTRRLKQEMTGNIAHELRTPVTSIRGYLETVLETPLPPEKKEDFIRKAYRQTLSLSELIRDMSLLTKIEDTPGSFNFGRVELRPVIGRVVAELEPALRAKRIVFDDELPEGLAVNGNENLLYSVFRNLTDNVINHAGEEVRITVCKRGERNGYVYISFADNGCGVGDRSKLNRLFERFYRLDEGRTRDAGGSGLGLSIVKNIVSLHGGTITVKERREGGLEFLFSLPTANEIVQ